MFFESQSADADITESLICRTTTRPWRVDSEYGRLTDVMLSAAPHLALVPCNAVAIEHERSGATCCPDLASRQHAALVAALENEGVRCHMVPPVRGMPDLSFTRDAVLMSPWGLIELAPAVGHRMAEVAHIRAAAKAWGAPLLGAVPEGAVEGGDVCMVRPGLVVIGYSGERTDAVGAAALAGIFERRGWRAIRTRFDPELLHLDTHFTMVDRTTALACIEVLEPRFVEEIQGLGITLIPVTRSEVEQLGANVLSLGDGRVLSSSGNRRVNAELERRGFRVTAVAIDQFTRCGGGIHCLTMPLNRLPA